jgi:hypothetical protein
MKFQTAVIAVLLTVAYFGYLFYLGIFKPDTIGYTEMLIGCGFLALSSWTITMGAFADIDAENEAKG